MARSGVCIGSQPSRRQPHGAGFCGPTRETVREAATRVKDVRVVDGQGRFSLDEQRIPRTGMNVLQVKDGRFVLAQ